VRRLFQLPRTLASLERDAADEIRFHLDSRVEELVERGMAFDDAVALAEREYGDVAASQRELALVDRRHHARERLAVTTAEELVRRELRRARLLAQAVGGMGAIALLLAAAGVYALMSFLVARRTREIGVRGALDASRTDLARLVLHDALCLAGAGTTLGLALSVCVAAALRSLLTGVSPFTPGRSP
jgi:predicted lysophospholipase L1 biosynthesis ABC-type transport system permease subunit